MQITENRFIAFLSDQKLFVIRFTPLGNVGAVPAARNTVAARIRQSRSFASARRSRAAEPPVTTLMV
jgi:hypothetical protein